MVSVQRVEEKGRGVIVLSTPRIELGGKQPSVNHTDNQSHPKARQGNGVLNLGGGKVASKQAKKKMKGLRIEGGDPGEKGEKKKGGKGGVCWYLLGAASYTRVKKGYQAEPQGGSGAEVEKKKNPAWDKEIGEVSRKGGGVLDKRTRLHRDE